MFYDLCNKRCISNIFFLNALRFGDTAFGKNFLLTEHTVPASALEAFRNALPENLLR